jgi:hypothetical protein
MLFTGNNSWVHGFRYIKTQQNQSQEGSRLTLAEKSSNEVTTNWMVVEATRMINNQWESTQYLANFNSIDCLFFRSIASC